MKQRFERKYFYSNKELEQSFNILKHVTRINEQFKRYPKNENMIMSRAFKLREEEFKQTQFLPIKDLQANFNFFKKMVIIVDKAQTFSFIKLLPLFKKELSLNPTKFKVIDEKTGERSFWVQADFETYNSYVERKSGIYEVKVIEFTNRFHTGDIIKIKFDGRSMPTVIEKINRKD